MMQGNNKTQIGALLTLAFCAMLLFITNASANPQHGDSMEVPYNEDTCTARPDPSEEQLLSILDIHLEGFVPSGQHWAGTTVHRTQSLHHALRRVVRLMALSHTFDDSNHLYNAQQQHKTLSILLHDNGYFIYNRCQMRC